MQAIEQQDPNKNKKINLESINILKGILKACLSCILFLFIIFIIFNIIILYFIAKSGIVNIFLMSSLVYKIPEPDYYTENLTDFDFMQRVLKNKNEIISGQEFETELNENELSFLLKKAVEEQTQKNLNPEDISYDIETIQTIIYEDKIQLFMHFKGRPEKTSIKNFYITSDIDIKWDPENKLQTDFENIKIGQLNIPKIVIKLYLEKQLDDFILQISDQLEQNAKIKNIIFDDKKVIIKIQTINLSEINQI